MYGELNDYRSSTGGAIFRLSPDGTYTVLHRLDSATEGNKPSALVEAADGNLYGTANTGGPGGGGTVFEVTPSGGFTVLQSFSSGSASCNPSGVLTVGSDGNLYGTNGYLHSVGGATNLGPETSFFQVTPSGPVSVLGLLDGATDKRIYPSSFVRGADGALYGFGYVGDQLYYTSQDLRRYTLDGSSTSVHRFQNSQFALADRPTVGADGNFYCQATQGGSVGEYGSFVRIDSNLDQTSHPGFFNGELALGNGVFYLTLGNANTFGYYSYLTDPQFIYHFDLGYEYLFDAADGHNGIYFYDFKSSTFFYTSPSFPFPYLYDFSLNTVLYYYPDPNDPSRYNANGTRYFYRFDNGQIITK